MTLKLKVHSDFCKSYLNSLPKYEFDWKQVPIHYNITAGTAEDAVVGLQLSSFHLNTARETENANVFHASLEVVYWFSVRLCFILCQKAVLPTKLFWDDGTQNRACVFCLLQNQSRLNSILKLTKVSLLLWNACEPILVYMGGSVYNGWLRHVGFVGVWKCECYTAKFPWQWNIVFCAELQCARRYDAKSVLSLHLFCLIQPFFWLTFTSWAHVLSFPLSTTC